MEIETLNAMNEGMYFTQMMIIKAILLMIASFAIVGITVYLAGIAWCYFEETRRSITVSRRARHASPPNTWELASRMPDTQQVRLTLVKQPRADARDTSGRQRRDQFAMQ